MTSGMIAIRWPKSSLKAAESTAMTVEESHYLPTAASLALLQVPIPPDYPQR